MLYGKWVLTGFGVFVTNQAFHKEARLTGIWLDAYGIPMVFRRGFRVAGIINNVKELWRVFLTHLQRKHSNSKKNHFVKSKSREILEKVSLCTGNAQQHSHRALKSIKFQHCCFIEILWSNKLENSCLKHTEK